MTNTPAGLLKATATKSIQRTPADRCRRGVLMLMWLAAVSCATAALGVETEFIFERDMPVPMRDGTKLAANVFRPRGEGRHPVVLVDRVREQSRDRLARRNQFVVMGPWAHGAGVQKVGELDVLVYTSAPLTEPLEVTGPVAMFLHAASTAPDTDFTAKLVDVHPDGRAFNLCEGIIRARFRRGLTQPVLLEPGAVERYEIDLWVTSNLFKPGHRIRLQVSSSNFPRFDRNPNSGLPFGTDTELRRATQTVYHDAVRPSHLLLPVIPRHTP